MNKIFLIFVLLIPAMAALGYDAYVYYENQEEGFKFTDLGWLWTTYSPDTHDDAFKQIGEEQWKQYVLPVLQLPTVIAMLIFAATVFVIVILVQALMSLGSGKFSPKKKKSGLGRDRSKNNRKFEYNRK